MSTVLLCDDCSHAQATSTFPGLGGFCADCAASRAGQPGGLPDLPPPPPPVTITGPDGRVHHLHYRVQRWPSGTGVDLVEDVEAGGAGGYHFSTISTIGHHDQPIDAQVRHLRELAQAEIARRYLEAHPPDGRVLLAGDQVVGRLVWPDDAPTFDRVPYNVVIDGHELTWTQLGQTLEPFEGFRFRLVIEDAIDEIGDQAT
jgi:hypothetical protein